MADTPRWNSTASVYVKITPSGITANLIQYGTSTITLGYEQDLTLDPGTFSVDLDGTAFNASVSVSSSDFFFTWILIFAGLELSVLLSHLRHTRFPTNKWLLIAHRRRSSGSFQPLLLAQPDK